MKCYCYKERMAEGVLLKEMASSVVLGFSNLKRVIVASKQANSDDDFSEREDSIDRERVLF